MVASSRWLTAPKSEKVVTSKYTPPPAWYAWPESSTEPIRVRMSEMAEVALGSDQAGISPERGHVGVEAADLLGGQVEEVDAELACLAEDVVVDVGDVADTSGLVAEVAQPPLEDVEGQVHLGVARDGPSRRG